MNKVKITVGLLIVCFSFSVMSLTVFADALVSPPSDSSGVSSQRTVLPETEKNISDCKGIMNEVSKNACWVQNKKFGKECKLPEGALVPAIGEDVSKNDILACGIKTGSMKMWMIPYYIKYVLEFIIGISGLTSVCGIIYGGYLYLFAGLSQDKDKGKKSIQYGVIGMILTLTAWALVNIIIALVTG